MRKTLCIFLLICFVHFLGQAQDDFDLNEINQVDQSGLKRGFWVEYEIDTLIEHWDAILSDTSGIDTTINYYIYQTGYYLNDKKDSIWNFYDTNRKTKGRNFIYGNLLFEAAYCNDSLNGTFKSYYLSGQLKSEVNIENGKANGIINVYFENGKLFLTGKMKCDKEFFNVTEFNINGNKLRERKFNYENVLKEWTCLYRILE